MSKIKQIVCVMHVPFEGPGSISGWAKRKGIPIKYVRLYKNDSFPELAADDMLLIMGGPMNVYDFHIHPWLEDEIQWVREILDQDKPVLGICLGAQIIATALNVEVTPGGKREIGWHLLQFLPSVGDFRIWKEHPGTCTAFHWHGDTFDIPVGAVGIASSEAFQNQGFIYGNRVVALQFHLEMTKKSVAGMIGNCRGDIVAGPYVQTEQEILGNTRHIAGNNRLMKGLMEWLTSFPPLVPGQ